MTDRTEHVLDAIDGALGDWDTSPDAMRWTPPEEPIPDDAEVGDPWDDDPLGFTVEVSGGFDGGNGNRYWIAEPGTPPPTGPAFPAGWQEVGYTTDDAPFRPSMAGQLMSDLILHGNAYMDTDGRRVDPANVIRRTAPDYYVTTPLGGSDYTPALLLHPRDAAELARHQRVRWVAETFDVPEDMLRFQSQFLTEQRMEVTWTPRRPSLLEQVLMPSGEMARLMEQMRETYRRAARNLTEGLSGIVRPTDDDPNETIRERALRLRQNRNTGPQPRRNQHGRQGTQGRIPPTSTRGMEVHRGPRIRGRRDHRR